AQRPGAWAANRGRWRARLVLPLAAPPSPPPAPPKRPMRLKRAGAAPPCEERGCLGAAARFEGLRRMAENPAAAARRLARRLKRDAGLARRIAAAPILPRDPFAPNAAAAQRHIEHDMIAIIA